MYKYLIHNKNITTLCDTLKTQKPLSLFYFLLTIVGKQNQSMCCWNISVMLENKLED